MASIKNCEHMNQKIIDYVSNGTNYYYIYCEDCKIYKPVEKLKETGEILGCSYALTNKIDELLYNDKNGDKAIRISNLIELHNNIIWNYTHKRGF